MVAERLRTLIDEKGIKYSYISNKTGISADALSKIFSNKKRLTADDMFKICEAAEIDVNSLRINKSA